MSKQRPVRDTDLLFPAEQKPRAEQVGQIEKPWAEQQPRVGKKREPRVTKMKNLGQNKKTQGAKFNILQQPMLTKLK